MSEYSWDKIKSNVALRNKFAQDRNDSIEQVLEPIVKSGMLQKTPTPICLVETMLDRLGKSKIKQDAEILVLFNIEYVPILMGQGYTNIWFYGDSSEKRKYAAELGVNSGLLNFSRYNKQLGVESVTWPKLRKQFDVVIMNPPYDKHSDNKGAGHTLWGLFVQLSLKLLRKDGYLCCVHPAGWRRPTGGFVELGQLMRSKQIEYLEMHSIDDGKRTFGVTTNYDWYVLRNASNAGATTVLFLDGKTLNINLKDIPCIPNGKFKAISKLLHNGKNPIEIIDDRSAYGADKDHVSMNKKGKFRHPCIYSLPQKGMQLRWSNTKKYGHFGVPKVIFSNGAAPQVIIDRKGEYGLTQWAFGIVDSPRNLTKIKAALESERFINLCQYMRFTLDRYDVKFMSCFRKDFWKDFV